MTTPYRSPWMTDDLDMLRTTARRFFEEEVAPKAPSFRAATPHRPRGLAEGRRTGAAVHEHAGGIRRTGRHLRPRGGRDGRTGAHLRHHLRLHPWRGATAPPSSTEPPPTSSCCAGCRTSLPAARCSSVCITEPDAGTDVKAMRTTARREGDEYVLNGNKIFITHGKQADLVAGGGAHGRLGFRRQGHLAVHGGDRQDPWIQGQQGAREDRPERLGHLRDLPGRGARARPRT